MKKVLLFLFVAFAATMSLNAQTQKAKVMKVLYGDIVLETFEVQSALKVVFEEEQDESTKGKATRKSGTETIEVNWVQLWEYGPKFAEYNVGAESETECGGHYAWGGSVDKGIDYNPYSDVLSGDNDTATKLWGDNWRMPTDRELTWMISKCTWTWTDDYKGDHSNIKGYILTGKEEGYTENSIFLPAAGYYDYDITEGKRTLKNEDYGYYWSSDPRSKQGALDIGTAEHIYFNSGDRVSSYSSRIDAESVRAVLK